MSEQMLEELREKNRVIQRIDEINAYLNSTSRSKFSNREVWQIVRHIEKGGGWL